MLKIFGYKSREIQWSVCQSQNRRTPRSALFCLICFQIFTLSVEAQPASPYKNRTKSHAYHFSDASSTIGKRGIGSPSATATMDAAMRVAVNVEENTAILENAIFKIKYARKYFRDSAVNNVITELLIKAADDENQVDDGQIDGVWMGYGKGRGALSKGSFVKYDGQDKKILHLEWGDGQVIQELTIYPENPVIKIDYIKYGINIVDIGSPGGDSGVYHFYKGEEWQKLRKTIKKEALIRNDNEHHKLTYDLHPAYPNPIVDTPDWEGLAPSPMVYKGWMIMGLTNEENGRGFGRVRPSDGINYLKLLWNRGFEAFPYWKGEGKGKEERPRPPFTEYIFVVSDGPNAVEQLGKKIADGTFH